MDAGVIVEALDALHEGVQIIGRDWRYLHVNEAAARHGRKTPAELVGRTMMECYPGIEATPTHSILDRCMRGRLAETLENEFTFEDGQSAWFELRIRPFGAGLIVVSLDTTERKGIEARQAATYRRALRELITPVIRVHDGVILVPLVGALERDRAAAMVDTIAVRAEAEHARVVILDVAGVPTLDTEVANHLLQTTSMIRLLGAATIVTGLSPAAAKALVKLGVDLSAMRTTSRLADGLELALSIVGRRIVGGA